MSSKGTLRLGMFPTHYSDGLAVEDLPYTRLDQARPEVLDLGKPTPPLVGRQADEKSTLPYLHVPTSCMTFHEMENGFEPYLRLPIGILYLYSTLWWADQVRHAAPHAARIPAGLFLEGFPFFPSFFFKSGARSPPGMIPRDVSLCDPAHAAGAYLSIVDPTMRVSSSYPFHRRVIVARLRRHRRRPPIYHPHTRSSS